MTILFDIGTASRFYEAMNFRELPNSDTHNCFGCGSKNTCGLKMKIFSDEQVVCSWLTLPAHVAGWNNAHISNPQSLQIPL